MSYTVLTVFLVFYIAIGVLTVAAAVKIVTKAGYSGWWVLVSFVPIVGFVMFFVFAFAKWPVQEQLEAAERAKRLAVMQSTTYGWDPKKSVGGRSGSGGAKGLGQLYGGPYGGGGAYGGGGPYGSRSWERR